MAQEANKMSSQTKLKRFLYISSEKPHFATGDPERLNLYQKDNLTCVEEYLNSSTPETLLNIIEIVNSEGLLPRRDAMFFVFTMALKTATAEGLRTRIYRTLFSVIKDIPDLFLFIKYYTLNDKKFGSGLNKLIRRFYNTKTPTELLEDITTCNGYHKWTHKDLLKLAHFRWEKRETSIIAVYLLFGLKKAELVAEGVEGASDIINHLRKLVRLKQTEDEKQAAEIVTELHCSFQRIPSIFHNSQVVWEALLPELTIREIINNLPRLYGYGFLKPNTQFQNKVVECLTSSDSIQRSRIHPVEVFMGLRNFEKGGRKIDPKRQEYLENLEKEDPVKAKRRKCTREPVKCPSVVSALHKAMQISFQNPQAWGRKIMITIDITKKMQKNCLNAPNINCLEAATILTLSMLRVEKDVTVAVFIDNGISILNIDKNATFNQAYCKIKQASETVTYCLPSASIAWAMTKKKPVDVFINFLYHEHWLLLIPKEVRNNEKPLLILNQYRKKMTLPHAKLISFSLGSAHLNLADGSPNILDISGCDKNVPPILEAFSKGLF